jgi:hypothetical protein
MFFRNAAHAKPARLPIAFNGLRAHDFSELAGGQSPQSIHLPHPVLGGHVTLKEDRILLRRRRDVRDSDRVSGNGSRTRYRSGDRSAGLRQGTPCIPPRGNQNGGE